MISQNISYILDFDRTLFDTDAFKKEQIKQHGESVVGRLASLEDLTVSNFLFDDAIAFLKAHDAAEMSVVSSCAGISGGWDTAYQKKKIEESGISEWVSEVHVVFDKKIEMIERLHTQKPTVFVDDMPAHVESVQSTFPDIHAVRIARKGTLGCEVPLQSKRIPTIEDLTELDAIIKI